MVKKRKQKKSRAAIQRVAVSLNPQYFGELPEALKNLPPPKSANETYFIYQRQADSGDFIVFFKTRWQDREYMNISAPQPGKSATVFSVMPESAFLDRSEFMDTLGYDIAWEKIIDIDWDVFKRFVITASETSIHGLLAYTSENDVNLPLLFSGTLLWLPRELRESVFAVGNFDTNIEEYLSLHLKS